MAFEDVFGNFSVEMSPDLARIMKLPRRPPLERGSAEAEGVIDAMTARYSRRAATCRCRDLAPRRFVDREGRPRDGCIRRLNYVQAWALAEMAQVGGLFMPAAVGAGKTIVSIMAPLAIPECKLALLLCPSKTAKQLCLEYELLREHFYVPQMFLDTTEPRSYDTVEWRGQPVLRVFPYSLLQQPKASAWISRLAPDLVIADECDMIANDSARTNRVLRAFRERPNTRMVAMSGSVTDDELSDYARTAALCLREGSPVPIDPMVVDSWGTALDAGAVCDPGALVELRAKDQSAETPIYDIFHRRFVETRGVVATGESSSDAELRVIEEPAPPIPPTVAGFLTALREDWIRPDGEILLDALAVSRCARELACGFFYYWHFLDEPLQSLIDEWKAARKAWRQELRTMIHERRENLDSEHLGEIAAMRAWGHAAPVAGMPLWRAKSWPRWRAAKGTVRYETRTHRVDPYLAIHAADWAHKNRGVVWYETRAFGLWVSEVGRIPLHAGGKGAEELIGREDGSRSIVASIKSHGRGRDGLQRIFCDQLVANPPSSATAFEQLLGRLDRQGQTSPIVLARFYRHTPELRKHVEQALTRARYVQGTIGAHQKLLAGFAE